MKSILKSAVAALLIVGSTHASANEGEFEITQVLTQNIASYIKTMNKELSNSLKQSLSINSQLLMTEVVENTSRTQGSDLEKIVKTELVAVQSQSNEG